jgi:hypothetical protein
MTRIGFYKQVVSLGRSCQPAHQIKRVFKSTYPSHVFDWILTRDIGLVDLIASNLDGFFARENIVWSDDGFFMDGRNGTQFNHEFPPQSDFDTQYADAAEKYAMLTERWRAMMSSEEPVLFVRHHGWDTDVRGAAIRIRNALRQRAPRLPFRLLYLCPDPSDDEAWGEHDIINRHLIQPDPYVWTGDDAAWERLLGEALAAPCEIPVSGGASHFRFT